VEKTSVDALVSTVIAERIIDVISLLILIALTIVVNVELFGNFFMDLFRDKLSFLIHLSLFAVILVALAGIIFVILFFDIKKQ